MRREKVNLHNKLKRGMKKVEWSKRREAYSIRFKQKFLKNKVKRERKKKGKKK